MACGIGINYVTEAGDIRLSTGFAQQAVQPRRTFRRNHAKVDNFVLVRRLAARSFKHITQ
jgi:hypothetical protein